MNDNRVQGTSVGLVVLEAPLQTWDSEKQRRNAADARVRLDQFAKCVRNLANEYSPGLLIVTWEDESLDEVTERVSFLIAPQLNISSVFRKVWLRLIECLLYPSNRPRTLIRDSQPLSMNCLWKVRYGSR